MARYKVEIIETLRHMVEVKAGNQQMAEQMVDDRWKHGEYILNADNFAGVEFKAVPVNETVSIPQLSWGNNRCKWR